MRIFMIVFYVVLVLIGVSFAALNASSVQINFYFKIFTMPISVLITIMLGLGALFGYILFLSKYWRLKAENRKIKNQLRLTEKEIKNLRCLPLQDQH